MHAHKLPPNQSTINERTRAMTTAASSAHASFCHFAPPPATYTLYAADPALIINTHTLASANKSNVHAHRALLCARRRLARSRSSSSSGAWQVCELESLGPGLQFSDSLLEGLVLVHQIADCRLEFACLLLVPRRHLDNALAQLLFPVRIDTRSFHISMDNSTGASIHGRRPNVHGGALPTGVVP